LSASFAVLFSCRFVGLLRCSLSRFFISHFAVFFFSSYLRFLARRPLFAVSPFVYRFQRPSSLSISDYNAGEKARTPGRDLNLKDSSWSPHSTAIDNCAMGISSLNAHKSRVVIEIRQL